MSEAGEAAHATPPFPSVAAPRLPALIGAFALDMVIAVATVLAVSLGASAVWGVARGFEVMREHGGQMPPGDQFVAALGEPGALAQMLIAIASTASAALLLYLWRRRADAGERARSLQAVRRPSTWGWSVLAGAVVFLFAALVGWLMQRLGSEPVPTNLVMIEEASRRFPVFLVVFAVVLAPAYEELLFRRVLFGRFLAAGWPWLGLVLSSLAFALVHEIPGLSNNPPLAVLQLWLVYAGMGAAFAWVYRRTGTLWAPIAAHALNNGLALLLHGFA